jgi:hypothetical protein
VAGRNKRGGDQSRAEICRLARVLLVAESTLLTVVGLLSFLCPDPLTPLQAQYIERLWKLVEGVGLTGLGALLGAVVERRSSGQ